MPTQVSPLYVRHWESTQPCRAILLIVHGMSEHSGRYQHFAHFLNQNQITVYAYDHRGHGKTVPAIDSLGHDSSANIWLQMQQDLLEMVHRIHAECPNLPIYLLGHSMGSFVVQHFLYHHSDLVDAVILSASNHAKSSMIRFGKWIARFECWRQGQSSHSFLIHKMSFAGFNNKFKQDGHTGFEWLSRDQQQVETYMLDPLCGFQCSNQFWYDFLNGLIQISDYTKLNNIKQGLPILILSGDQDPIGEYGNGVKKLLKQFQKYRLNAQIKLFPGGRHEMLNETNQQEVYQFILQWLNQ